MNEIEFRHVYKAYEGNGDWAVEDINLKVPSRSLVVLLGPSGCGKTTLLKMVNRLVEPTRGTILLDGEDIRKEPPTDLRRRIGYSIQQVGLMPHMTVERNIAIVPRMLGWTAERIEARVLELMAVMDLDPGVYLSRYPSELSGGQQQRVGIARALAADPNLLLMDEPFGALDAINRRDLQDEICRLQGKLKKTVLFVTHDVDEALRLADMIVVLRRGRVVQFARPAELLGSPANDFVRRLLDSDDRIRQLGQLPVTRLMKPLPENIPEGYSRIEYGASARDALNPLLSRHVSGVVVYQDGQAAGWLTLDDLRFTGMEAEAGEPVLQKDCSEQAVGKSQ